MRNSQLFRSSVQSLGLVWHCIPVMLKICQSLLFTQRWGYHQAPPGSMSCRSTPAYCRCTGPNSLQGFSCYRAHRWSCASWPPSLQVYWSPSSPFGREYTLLKVPASISKSLFHVHSSGSVPYHRR